MRRVCERDRGGHRMNRNFLPPEARDRLYAECARAISEAGAAPGEPSAEPVPEPSLYSIAGESGVGPSAPPAWTAGSRKAAGLPAEESASPNATK